MGGGFSMPILYFSKGHCACPEGIEGTPMGQRDNLQKRTGCFTRNDVMKICLTNGYASSFQVFL
jgi:hypothetical protein